MSSNTPPVLASPMGPIHPLPIGTLIDGGSLELVEVLFVGRHSVVYRAVDTRPSSRSYAVKCLVASEQQSTRTRQRQIHWHIREIALHQLASFHPGVVTLHRVIEQDNHTYIVMDYAPDHNLCTQILHNCRYLGKDMLIKDVFLQLLDAVQYCHSLGIYHRDLKPDNILCFNAGFRVAITDFGLATTDKVSKEFRTGSVYYMSPESQGGRSAPTGNYSPMSNDIWSLGIILLNLATGRIPWNSATPSDPGFLAYLRDPVGFLPTILPISSEVNNILIRMLDVDWRQRINLREVRYAVERVSSFYSDGVIFEGSMTRCPWESEMNIDSASSSSNVESGPVSTPAQPLLYVDDPAPLSSHWRDSITDNVVVTSSLDEGSSYYGHWGTTSSGGATRAFKFPISFDPDNEHEHEHFRMELWKRSRRWAISPYMPISPPISTGRPTSSITSYYVPSVIDWTEDGNYNLAAAALANQSIRSYSTTTISTDYGSIFFARSLRASSTSLLGSFKSRSLLQSR